MKDSYPNLVDLNLPVCSRPNNGRQYKGMEAAPRSIPFVEPITVETIIGGGA